MKQISKVKIVLVVICVLATGFAFVNPASGNAEPEPTVNDWVVSWADNGWYQVQTADGEEVCQGDRSCDVKAAGGAAGEYRVINLTTGKRYDLVTVPNSGSSDNGSDGGSGEGSDNSAGVTVTPRFKTLGVNDGYVKVIIHPVPSGTKVNVFRNGEYVATLQNGDTVVNDDKGRNGHTYRLVALVDEVEVGRTEQKVSATDGEGTAKADLVIPDGMKLYWGPRSGYTYSIYRKDSGGTVGYNEGTRLATGLTGSLSGPAFVDPNPKRGASYGIVGKTNTGSLTPVLTVRPDYDRPTVRTVPQAFENGFFIFGEGLRLSPPANRCDYDDSVPNTRYCQVSGPGQYTVTHLASQKSWTVDVKGPSPATNRFVVVNGVRVLVSDTNYGSILVMKNDAELEAVTGLKAPRSGATARNAADGYPPVEKYFHYTVPMRIDQSPQDVSSNVGVIHVYEYSDDGSVGREVGHWVDGNYYNPEQYDQLVADRFRNGAYYTTKGGTIAFQFSPWGRAGGFVRQRGWDLLNWALDTFIGPNRVPDTDNDGDDSPFCSGGSGCHNGIELNEQTDPDGDGLSVFGDDDNDGDGASVLEDDDDTNPDCQTNCHGGGSGGSSDTNDGHTGPAGNDGDDSDDDTGCTNCSGGGDDDDDSDDTGGDKSTTGVVEDGTGG